MSTNRNFGDMLNEYLPNKMLKEDLLERDYILKNVDKDDNWKGGKDIVPFTAANATSVSFGQLTASNDIAQSQKIRGSIDAYVEVWGSLIFDHRDLQEHDGKIPETTFLRILPDEVEGFMDYMKQVTSIQLGSGPHFATVTDATNAATGIMIVDRMDRFQLGQKATLDDANSNQVDVYATAINVDTGAVTFSLTRGGAAADLSAYSVAQTARFYHPGVTDGSGTFTTFVSLRNALLSAANGGSTTLHGKTKTLYPALQAVNISGAAITATNILDKIFDAYTTVRTKARGKATDVLMSFKHMGSIMKLVDAQKGPYSVTKGASSSLYGWLELEVTSVKGTLKLVAIQEMDDDVMFFVDWTAMTFRSNGFFKKRKSPEGKEYFEIRSTTGYAYIVDISLFGELEVRKPGNMAVIYSIPNY